MACDGSTFSVLSGCDERTNDVPPYWPRVAGRQCYDMIASHATDAEAVVACEADAACLHIYDGGCDGSGDWKTCSTDVETPRSSGECMYDKFEGDLVCTAFSTTYPSTPDGYIVPNVDATTLSELGTLNCASGYEGIAGRWVVSSCDTTGGAFAATGCQTCTPFSTTYQTTPGGYIVPNTDATTVSGLGTLSCASGYDGTPLVSCDGTAFSVLLGCEARTSGVPSYWPHLGGRECYDDARGMIASYATVAGAMMACEADVACLYICDGGCDNAGEWKTCSTDGDSQSSSCMYEKVKLACTAFSSTYASTPGYIVPNVDATTVARLGTLACASGWEGTPDVVTCDGTTFSALSGCQTCTPFSTSYPSTPAGYIVPNADATTVAELGTLVCASGYSGNPTTTCDGASFSHPAGCWHIVTGFSMTNELVFAAVEECKIESQVGATVAPVGYTLQANYDPGNNCATWGEACDATFDCPTSQQTYGHISTWDVSGVTKFNCYGDSWCPYTNADSWKSHLAGLLVGCTNFDHDLSGWQTGKINTMRGMFYGTSSFSGSLADWNIEDVEDFSRMFSSSGYTGDISSWSPTSAVTMEWMFAESAMRTDHCGWEGGTYGACTTDPWGVADVNTNYMYENSCLSGTTAYCEPECAAFATTFATTPIGYQVVASATTMSGLQRACASGYEGYPVTMCDGTPSTCAASSANGWQADLAGCEASVGTFSALVGCCAPGGTYSGEPSVGCCAPGGTYSGEPSIGCCAPGEAYSGDPLVGCCTSAYSSLAGCCAPPGVYSGEPLVGCCQAGEVYSGEPLVGCCPFGTAYAGTVALGCTDIPCAAFDASFLETPVGYVVTNPSGTIASELGLACTSGHEGTPRTSCIGGEFMPLSGCSRCSTGSVSIGGSNCEACSDLGSVANGAQTTCVTCAPGKEALLDKSACASCAASNFSAFGIACTECASPNVVNAERATCSLCVAGTGPNENRTDCAPCIGTTYSATGLCRECDAPNVVDASHQTCSACSPGEQPNTDRTVCEACTGATYSSFGAECQACAEPSVVNEERTTCSPCSAGQGPSDDLTACESCRGTTYSTIGQCQDCAAPGIVDASHQTCSSCAPGQEPNLYRTACVSCNGTTSSAFGVECTECVAPSVVNADRTTCSACAAGTGPNADRSGCIDCAGTTYSTIGQCQDCDTPSVVDASHQTCSACSPGEQPNIDRTACEACTGATFSSFGVECQACAEPSVVNEGRTTCSACLPGTGPSVNRTSCQDCVGNTYSTFGTCQPCAAGSVANVEHTGCDKCPVNQVTNEAADGCVCDDGFFDATNGLLAWYDVGEDFVAADLKLLASMIDNTTGVITDADQCQPCDELFVRCHSGVASLRPGAALSELAKANQAGAPASVGYIRAPAAVFLCPFDGCLGETNSTNASKSACDAGYTGALCAVCDSNASYLRSGKACIECSGASGKSVVVALGCVVIAFAATLGVACVAKVKVLIGHAEAGLEKVESDELHVGGLMVQVKILIGLLQIVTELPSSLNLRYPQPFSGLLDAARVLMLDVFGMFSLDCVAPLSMHLKFVAIMLLPVVGIGIVQLWACISVKLASRGGLTDEELAGKKASIRAASAYRSFFIIFLLYPLLSRTAFHMFGCQTLDTGESWHLDDYAIDCGSSTHKSFVIAALVAVCVYPVGIPLGFLVILWRDERNRNRTNVAGNDGGSEYDFLRQDYSPRYYYFECISLIEKLLLTGLLIFVDQASVLQAFCGLCIAFVFFAVQCRAMPYADANDNSLKVIAEAQLFVTLAISVVLRTDLRGEVLEAEDYGLILTVCFFAAPMAFVALMMHTWALKHCCRRAHETGQQPTTKVETEASMIEAEGGRDESAPDDVLLMIPPLEPKQAGAQVPVDTPSMAQLQAQLDELRAIEMTETPEAGRKVSKEHLQVQLDAVRVLDPA